MELIAFLFLVVLTIGSMVIALVALVVLHLRQRELVSTANRLRGKLVSAAADLHHLEDRVRRVEQRTRVTSEPAPLLETSLDEVIDEAPSPVEPTTAPPVPALRTTTTSTAAASRGAGFERQLGTRVAVWIGALALSFAGIFLVKYTIDRSLLGPTARVALGLGFGVVLLAAAEWIRRRSAGIAQGLAASGVAVLFAALLAGVKLYGLIPPAIGLLGMLLTTATAVVLSMRHGQMVAILGLLGGFLTPFFIGGESPRPWMLFSYLLLIQSGLLLLSRKMRWWPVAGLSLVAGMGWAALWIVGSVTSGVGSFPVGLFLIASIFSYVFLAAGITPDQRSGGFDVGLSLVWGGVGIGMLLLCGLLGVGDFGLMEWAFLGVVGAGCLVLARRDRNYEGLAWLAALAGAGMLLVWGFELEAIEGSRVWWIAASLTALYVGGSYLAMCGSERPARWAALSGLSAVAYFLATYAVLDGFVASFPWGTVGLGMAALLGALAIPVARRRSGLAQGDAALASYALAATALVGLVVPIELKREWIGVAWALQIPALAWVATRLRLPVLGGAAWALAGLVGLRLLLNPVVLTYPTGDGVVFNWLFHGYGVPLVALAVGALLFRRLGEQRLARALEVGSILLGLAWATLGVRQFFHPGDLNADAFLLSEWGGFTVVWLLFALAMLGLHRLTGRALFLRSGAVIGVLALAQGVAVSGLAENPLFQPHQVGEIPIFNRLLFVYGLPGILAGLMARVLSRAGSTVAARLAGCGALVFAFATITLELRQAFHGSMLQGGTTGDPEMYAYSLAWILFATTLLVAGIVRSGTVLRYASAVVMALAVGKVFLVDTAHIQGLYRVVSLFVLGLSLMLLAFLYQKFVFGEARR